VNWYARGCPRLLYAQHVEGGGKELFNEICRCDLEGIVAKRKMGMYREDRPDWLKEKKENVFAGRGKARIADEKRQERLMARVSVRGVRVSGPAPRQRRAMRLPRMGLQRIT
jgi:hypothetical protein